MTSHTRFWRKSAAPVAAALIGLGAYNVQALSLGKVRVQSALGQSLVAEIDISDLSEEDSKSLRSALASPAAFIGMGLEYNPALNGTQIALQRRPNGNRFLKLVSTKPLNDPFIDLVVELSWSSGRIVRTYTILLDPPKNQDTATPIVLSVPSAEAPVEQVAPPSPSVVPPVAPTTITSASQALPAATNTASAKAAPSVPQTGSAPSAALERKRIRVGKGDTAGKLARSMVPEGMNIEQTLVALLNANPSAFFGGNINRLRAGAELTVPDAALVSKTTQPEARQILDVQNQAFQRLRRDLATQVPPMGAPVPSQESAGKVTKPEATGAPAVTPSDTLKLSKDSVQSKADKESMEQIAKQRAKTEASERAAELAKNIEELNQLAKIAAKPVEPTTSAPVAVPSATVAAPAANQASSTNPAKSIPITVPVTPAKPSERALSAQDIVDGALENPGILVGLLALLGLGGYGIYRRTRKTRSPADSIRKDGASQWATSANTSFDTVGGQRVDTSDAQTVGLVTMVYPDSQLEMVNELDPVAEAEVYLAYGKDIPAEEILKEGLQQDPSRVAIHLKLLGIYVKRGDLKSFESMAQEMKPLVDSSSPEWAQVQEMGKSIDPSNPLYGQKAAASNPVEKDSGFEQSMFNLDTQSLNSLSSGPTAPTVAFAVMPRAEVSGAGGPKPEARSKAPVKDETDIDFDLASIALKPATEVRAAPVQTGDRLDATLALAEQFIEIGEKEGARALLEEVIADGSDTLRQRAKTLLSRIQ